MSKLYQYFKVEANILYGDIDYIKGVPLGKLAVNLRGDPEQVEKSLAFLREHKVNVEMLK